MTIVRIGSTCFLAYILGTVVSITLVQIASAAAGNAGYSAILVDPRYQLAGAIMSVDLVLEIIGFGVLAFYLQSRSRFGAWAAFASLSLGNLLGIVFNCAELVNSVNPKSMEKYESIFFSLLSLVLRPLQLVGFLLFGLVLLAGPKPAKIFGWICLLGVPEALFAMYFMDSAEAQLKAVLWIECIFNIAFCSAALVWLNSKTTQAIDSLEAEKSISS